MKTLDNLFNELEREAETRFAADRESGILENEANERSARYAAEMKRMHANGCIQDEEE